MACRPFCLAQAIIDPQATDPLPAASTLVMSALHSLFLRFYHSLGNLGNRLYIGKGPDAFPSPPHFPSA